MMQKTPLGRVIGLGSAKSGTEHFWHQRVTAIAGIPLVIFLIGFVLAHIGASRAEIIASLSNPLVAILLALTVVNLLWHMRPARKFAALLFNTFFTMAMGAAALYAILKMSFGL